VECRFAAGFADSTGLAPFSKVGNKIPLKESLSFRITGHVEQGKRTVYIASNTKPANKAAPPSLLKEGGWGEVPKCREYLTHY
jgi:hypothetical protein